MLEAEAPGAAVYAVARTHGLSSSVLFRWRAQFGYGKSEAQFARARFARDDAATTALQSLLPIPDGAVPVDLPGGRRVYAPPGSDPEAVRRFVAEREAGR